MGERIQEHPAYAEGYWAAIDGDPLFPDAADEYRAGWQAAQKSMEILRDAGFTGHGRNWSKTTPNTREKSRER